jgi:glutamate--cysteine ligase
MIQDQVHKAISDKHDSLIEWFMGKRKGLHIPFYTSFDIRDSGFKVVPVDANLFPAGFNNICQADKETSVELVESYFKDHYPEHFSRVAILTEEHTNNPYYWDNVHTLKSLLEEAGKTVQVAIPSKLKQPLQIESASGFSMTVHSAIRDGASFVVDGKSPDVVISNNDFSQSYSEWAEGLMVPMNPPREMGWYQRKKMNFFRKYNELAAEFCQQIDFDPWALSVATEPFDNFDINSEDNRRQLAERVDAMIDDLLVEYKKRGIELSPTVFVKNNSGTYGLGVTKVVSGDDVRTWNNKSRKKMKAAKGGGGIASVIVQEGVPSMVTSDGATAEPAIYMLGCKLAGGFLRAHEKKAADESLNSPGAVYKRLCVSDLRVNVEGHPMENVYGWVARLSLLAVSQEMKSEQVELRSYELGPDC